MEEQVSKARQECSKLRQQLQVVFSVSLSLYTFFPSGVLRAVEISCQENQKYISLILKKHLLLKILVHVQDVSGQLNESVASFESLSSTRSLKEEEQEARIKQLERELRTATSEKVNLQSQMTLLQTREGKYCKFRIG